MYMHIGVYIYIYTCGAAYAVALPTEQALRPNGCLAKGDVGTYSL